MIYKPEAYFKDIFSINYNLLKKKGIKCLLIDLDNTIARVDEKYPEDKIITLINKLKKDFKVIIFSNAITPRVNRFKKNLDLDAIPIACKPFSFSYKKVLKKYNYKEKEIAAIGDQIYTDIKGANKMNITSILIDPISSKESLITKINRYKENKLIRNKKIIIRGEYYE